MRGRLSNIPAALRQRVWKHHLGYVHGMRTGHWMRPQLPRAVIHLWKQLCPGTIRQWVRRGLNWSMYKLRKHSQPRMVLLGMWERLSWRHCALSHKHIQSSQRRNASRQLHRLPSGLRQQWKHRRYRVCLHRWNLHDVNSRAEVRIVSERILSRTQRPDDLRQMRQRQVHHWDQNVIPQRMRSLQRQEQAPRRRGLEGRGLPRLHMHVGMLIGLRKESSQSQGRLRVDRRGHPTPRDHTRATARRHNDHPSGPSHHTRPEHPKHPSSPNAPSTTATSTTRPTPTPTSTSTATPTASPHATLVASLLTLAFITFNAHRPTQDTAPV